MAAQKGLEINEFGAHTQAVPGARYFFKLSNTNFSAQSVCDLFRRVFLKIEIDDIHDSDNNYRYL